MSEMHIYGATEGKDSICHDRYGFLISATAIDTKDLFPEDEAYLPIARLLDAGTWEGNTEFSSVYFHDFDTSAPASCPDVKQRAIGINPYASDASQMNVFTTATFDNVIEDAVAYFISQEESLAEGICGRGLVECGGLQNTVVQFAGTLFSGSSDFDLTF